MDEYVKLWLNNKFEELHASLENLSENINKIQSEIVALEKHNIKCPRLKVEQIENETEIIRFFTKNKFIAGCFILGFIFVIGLEFFRIIK